MLALCSAVVSLLVFLILSRSPARAQSQPSPGTAVLHGTLRDAQGQPVASAEVSLQPKTGGPERHTRTDSQGKFTFVDLTAGAYLLRADVPGKGTALLDDLVLEPNKITNVAPILRIAANSAAPARALSAPEFSDEPKYTIAGIADTSNLGLHGSDTVVRTRDALTKATVSLNHDPRATPPSASPDPKRENELRATLQRDPANFDANRDLGRYLEETGRCRDSLPYLEEASRLRPADSANASELVRAYADSGNYEQARATARKLLGPGDTAILHHALADIAEKANDPLEAVREYERAATLASTEPNLFDWGSELLLHHAPEPAADVFTKGVREFPASIRMSTALGVAWYVRGSYERAAKQLCQASDLNPQDPSPYLFLGKLQESETTPSPDIAARLRRFVTLQPNSAQAHYYYAVSLFKSRAPGDTQATADVESHLHRALQLDPTLAEAHLHLGILYAERRDFPKAIVAYQQAISLDPNLAPAHYRLAEAYRATGDSEKARSELQKYEQVSKEAEARSDRERHQLQRFVYSLRQDASSPPPQP